jgi:hypothetical protein
MILIVAGQPAKFHHTNPLSEGTPNFEHVTTITMDEVVVLDPESSQSPLMVLCGMCPARAAVPLNGDRGAQMLHALYRAYRDNVPFESAMDSVATDVAALGGNVRVGW